MDAAAIAKQLVRYRDVYFSEASFVEQVEDVIDVLIDKGKEPTVENVAAELDNQAERNYERFLEHFYGGG